MKMGCQASLAPGQWWAYCGETDMGQSMPVLCEACDPKNGLVRADNPDAANKVRHQRKLVAAYSHIHKREKYDWNCKICGAPNADIFSGRAFICEPMERAR